MAPPDGGGREPLMSMEEIDALLLGSLDDTEGAGHAVPPWWRTMLHVIPLKKKLELLTLSLGFEERLRKASPKEVHNMVDQGIFKVLCMQLGGFRGIDAAHELWGTGFAVCTDRISTFLDTCPELCAKAWAYGVVPPVTAVVMKKRDLSNPKVLRDQPLRAALGFLVSMGVPWQDQLDDPRSQQGEATKATGKCYCWMTKEGVVDAVVEIWCALPKFDSKDREDSHFSKLSSYCAAVLWYATSVHLKRPPLASNAGEKAAQTAGFFLQKVCTSVCHQGERLCPGEMAVGSAFGLERRAIQESFYLPGKGLFSLASWQLCSDLEKSVLATSGHTSSST